MTKVLVLGASGHIGSHLTRCLVHEGYDTRVMLQPSSVTYGIDNLAVEKVYGDVLNPQEVLRATQGCEEVYHLASPTTLVSNVKEVIVGGTRNVIDACTKSGVKRLVYTSSVVTIGFSDSPQDFLDEQHDRFIGASLYHVGKREAEKLVLNAASDLLSVVVVNPSTVVGSGAYRSTPSIQPIRKAMKRPLPAWFDSGVTVAHVKDVAEGHVLAMKYGKSGEKYILGGEALSIKDYFSLINAVMGFGPCKIKIPKVSLLAIGTLYSFVQALGKKDVPFDYARAKALAGKYGFYSSDKAKKELGYKISGARAAIEDYLNWKTETEEVSRSQ